MPPTSSQARLSRSPCRGRGSASRASASRSRASVFGPIPGTVRAGPRRPPREARRRCGCRAPARARPSASRQPEVAAEADEIGRELALEFCQLGDRRPSRRARAAVPRSPGRYRAARAPAQTSPAPRPGTPRRGSSRRRDGRRAPCTGSPRRARATTRTRPGGRRSADCPPAVVLLLRSALHPSGVLEVR